MTTQPSKPLPPDPREPLSVQVVTRLTDNGRDRIRALAETEGVTIQQLGLYAWSLALVAYGEKPLDEAAA